MDNNQLPLLSLSDEQRLVLEAHAANAVAQIVSLRFSGSPDKNLESMLSSAYQRGRLDAFTGLQNYDTEVVVAQNPTENQ